MLVKVLSPYDLQQLMCRWHRDYFTFEGYGAIIDYFDESDDVVDLDPVALSCEFSEDDVLTVWDDYKHLFKDFPEPDVENGDFHEWCSAFVEELNYYTWAILLDNGDILYRVF